jgi:hypothetical protein
MARRAKSTFNPLHLAGVLGFLALIALGGYVLLHRSGDSGGSGNELSLREYLDNSNALSGNAYRIEGVIEDRLDQWPSRDGRLFSVRIEEGSDGSAVPVLVPAKFSNTNIQRLQRFRFKVRVQAETGLLEAEDVVKI